MIKTNKTVLKKVTEYLENLEKRLINVAAKSGVGCDVEITTEECKAGEDMYVFSNNAKMSIKGSNGAAGNMTKFLNDEKKQMEAVIDSTTQIKIDVKFDGNKPAAEVNNESKKENESTAKKDAERISQFIAINPLYKMEQVILPKELKDEIEEALSIISCQDLIYEEWGFGEIDPAPKSVLNFYGPPGTGKTMCAHAVADRVGRKIMALNYSEIESKFVGEAPKNIMAAFEAAKQQDCVLFFDEADSFLGKRIQNVQQGSEQAINSLRSQMLILLEDFQGIVIFATNLQGNYDRAFESRILKHLKFDMPNEEARKEIIKHKLPKRLPLEKELTDEDYTEMSKRSEGLSGREIKNAILETMLSKVAKEGRDVTFTAEDFAIGFEKKIEMNKKLEEERKREKKEKIIQSIKDKAEAEAEAAKQEKENATEEKETEENKAEEVVAEGK